MKRTELKRKTPLGRGKPLASGSGLKRGPGPGMKRSRMKATNPERRKAKYERNYGDHATEIRAMPCLCKLGCQGDIVAAHVVARGMGGAKGGWADLVPLCARHHDYAGEHGTSARALFEGLHGLGLRVIADRLAGPRILALSESWAADRSSVVGYDLDALIGWSRRWLDHNGSRTDAMAVYASIVDLAIVLKLGSDTNGRELAGLAEWPS